MRQRVALLRTLLLQRPLLLLDEPFAALDALTRRELQDWLRDTWTSGSEAALLVTHDVREAIYLSNRVYVMSGRRARIVAEIEVADGARARRRTRCAGTRSRSRSCDALHLRARRRRMHRAGPARRRQPAAAPTPRARFARLRCIGGACRRSLLLAGAVRRLGDLRRAVRHQPRHAAGAFAHPRSRLAQPRRCSGTTRWSRSRRRCSGLGVSIVRRRSALALLIDAFAPVRRALYPLLVGSQTLPVVVIAPLIVLWFGFELTPKILVVTLYTFFPITVAFASGLAATSEEALVLMRTLGAKRLQDAALAAKCHKRCPTYSPACASAVTYAMIGAVFAEWSGARNGLGIYILLMKNSFRTDMVLAAIFLIAVLSLGLFVLVGVIERLVVRWR